MGLRDYVMQVGALMVASAAILAVWAVHARLQRPSAESSRKPAEPSGGSEGSAERTGGSEGASRSRSRSRRGPVTPKTSPASRRGRKKRADEDDSR